MTVPRKHGGYFLAAFGVGLATSPSDVAAQADTAFAGRPSAIAMDSAIGRRVDKLDGVDAARNNCVITLSGGRYFWASRGNIELTRIQGKSTDPFVTFLAVDGSGYVTVVKSVYQSTMKLLQKELADYDYVEHVAHGLRSATYYGGFTKGFVDLGPTR
jgi:hypothetical protein